MLFYSDLQYQMCMLVVITFLVEWQSGKMASAMKNVWIMCHWISLCLLNVCLDFVFSTFHLSRSMKDWLQRWSFHDKDAVTTAKNAKSVMVPVEKSFCCISSHWCHCAPCFCCTLFGNKQETFFPECPMCIHYVRESENRILAEYKNYLPLFLLFLFSVVYHLFLWKFFFSHFFVILIFTFMFFVFLFIIFWIEYLQTETVFFFFLTSK